MNRMAIWMARPFLEAANHAAHEWFLEMGVHGPRVLDAFGTTRSVSASTMAREVLLTVAEADALARACACAVHALTGRLDQRPEDRRYRRQLVDALSQLSKVGL